MYTKKIHYYNYYYYTKYDLIQPEITRLDRKVLLEVS